MQAARKFETFCVDTEERWVFAGNLSGQIAVIDIDSFRIIGEVQAHAGTIIAMAAHPTLPYISCLGMDRTVSVWTYDSHGNLRPLCQASIRDVRPTNDPENVGFVHSNAQTLGIHSTKRQIVTRSGNAGVLELEFDDNGGIRVLSCMRLHHDMDVITARYAHESDMVLTGSGDGELLLSQRGEVVRRWQISNTSIHWLEHVEGDDYLLASDSRFAARVDISGEKDVVSGAPFPRDDFEQISYNPVSGRAFGASFDRNVYEIDPRTCEPLGVTYRAPFKCRWLKSLKRAPNVLIVQVRDGGMHKVDVESGTCLAMIRETPEALWTGVATEEGEILLTGEGDTMMRLRTVAVDRSALKPVFSIERRPLNLPKDTYTKRMVIQRSTGRVVLGRTDGDIVLLENGRTRVVTNLGSAVRDLAVHPELPVVFVACENGEVYRLHLDSGETPATFRSPDDRPFWSMSYNPIRNVLAVLERFGRVYVLDAGTFAEVLSTDDAGRTKRAKWVDQDRLFFSHGEELHTLDLRDGRQSPLIRYAGNSIEDFIWDPGQNYLVLVCYTWRLLLYDFQTGQKLAEVPDQIDYSKGLIWIPQRPGAGTYPLDLLTFGRSGTAHHYRIHNENIQAFGEIGLELGEGAR
jgi:WD40 repeat protein